MTYLNLIGNILSYRPDICKYKSASYDKIRHQITKKLPSIIRFTISLLAYVDIKTFFQHIQCVKSSFRCPSLFSLVRKRTSIFVESINSLLSGLPGGIPASLPKYHKILICSLRYYTTDRPVIHVYAVK